MANARGPLGAAYGVLRRRMKQRAKTWRQDAVLLKVLPELLEAHSDQEMPEGLDQEVLAYAGSLIIEGEAMQKAAEVLGQIRNRQEQE